MNLDPHNFNRELFDSFQFSQPTPEQLRPFNPENAPQVLRYLNRPMHEQSPRIIKTWREIPKTFVIDNFDVILDDWQEEFLENYMLHERVGVIASKGPGKTATLSWIGLHFLTLYFETKLAALSITKDHLKDNLWSELLKWRSRSEVLKKTISDGMDKIEVYGKEGISFISARSFPKGADEAQMQSSLAGLHADNVGFLIDEAGMMPDTIFVTADAALANADKGPNYKGKYPKRARLMVVANPERPSGLIYRAFTGDPKVAHLWKIMNITSDPDSPKRTSRVTKEWAQSVIDLFGRDHPYTKINVFGEYPDSTTDMLLSEREVDEAMNREVRPEDYNYRQQRLGVDVARGGSDSTILFRRQGLKAFPATIVPSTENGFQVGARVLHQGEVTGVRRAYVDATGGYGASVIDFLRTEGTMDVISVVYNANATKPEQYANKRTEMWVKMRDWIRNGGSLPKDEYLKKDLLTPLLFFNGTKFKLESKEDIRKRLGRSPDRADALAQTFADPEDFVDRLPESANDPLLERYLANDRKRYYADSSDTDNYYERMLRNYQA